MAAVEGPEAGGEGWGGPSQPGCPGPGSGGGGSGGAAGAVPESEPGEVGSGPPAGLGVGTGAGEIPQKRIRKFRGKILDVTELPSNSSGLLGFL